jgi:hypothetical protein
MGMQFFLLSSEEVRTVLLISVTSVFLLRALEVWGSHDNLLKELRIRDAKRKTYQQSE